MDDNAHLLQAARLAARRLASNESLDTLLHDVLQICVEAVGAEGGTIYVHDKERRRLRFRHVLPESVAANMQDQDIPDDFGVAGRVFRTRQAEISSFPAGGDPGRGDIERKVGVVAKTMITVPLSIEDEDPIGVVQLVNKREGEFNVNDVAVLDIVASVSTLAYMNSVLLQEQTRSSQLLGMGKVAHDIKNMAFALEANLNFSSETVKQMKARIKRSGDDPSLVADATTIESMFHELGDSIERIKQYSILISDLSAGKALNPKFQTARAAPVIERAASYLETEGRRQAIAIRYECDHDAPPLQYDEMFLSRIVQNLVSNAVKAAAERIPDAERAAAAERNDSLDFVTVRYFVDARGHVLEVEDHGPGMSPDTVRRILTGNARSYWSKSGGSGWGTKIVLELAATHQADVEIESEVGKGSVFRVVFPVDTESPSPS